MVKEFKDKGKFEGNSKSKGNFNHLKKDNYSKNGQNKHKVTNRELLSEYAFKSTKNAEWFKRTISKIEEVKLELDNKFLSEAQRAAKIDFIRKLSTKVKDYKDAHKNAVLYKKIRFFERRKLERILKKLNKEKEGDEENEKQKKKIIDDIEYVKVSMII